mgnify:FL=1
MWTLVSFKQQGADADELLRNYPGLILADLDAAWAYYQEHPQEIDSVIRDDELEDG